MSSPESDLWLFFISFQLIQGNPRQSWILDSGFWTLDCGFQSLAGFLIPCAEFWIPEPSLGFRIPQAKIFPILESALPYMERNIASWWMRGKLHTT